MRFADSLSQVRELAKSDIANQKMFLLLSSGISPIVYSTDLRFENDFKIKYLESGCTGPKEEFAIEYNNTIFNYLTDKHGTKWKKDVRKDVSGLKTTNSGKINRLFNFQDSSDHVQCFCQELST